MGFRGVGTFVSKIQFTSSTEMPHLIYQACLRTGIPSNTAYCQRALAERLARDLGMDLDRLLGALPPNRGPAAHLYNPDGGHPMARHTKVGITVDPTGGTFHIGPANTVEEVK